MTLISPTLVDDPAPCDVDDAAIREAKRRVRRRRRRNGGVLAVVLAGVAAFVAWGPASPPPTGPPATAAPGDADSIAAGDAGQQSDNSAGDSATLRGGTDRAATLVAAWGQTHWGWVIVYGDGRVLLLADTDGLVPDGAVRYSILERYLTPAGLESVRSGTVAPSRFLGERVGAHGRVVIFRNPLLDDMWADPEFSVYAPSEFSLCPHSDERPLDLTTALGMLPEPVQQLLRGTQRTYTGFNPRPGAPERPPGECFTLPPGQASTVVGVADDYHETRTKALDELAAGGGVDVRFNAPDGTIVGLHIRPVMPDGQVIVWLG